MTLPAQAFATKAPRDLLPGQLSQTRGSWALRIAYTVQQRTVHGFVVLEGDLAGRLFDVREGMDSGLCIAAPFSWFPAVSAAVPSADSLAASALTLAPSGIVILGGRTDTWGESDHIAFDVAGHELPDFEERGVPLRFSRWTIELQHDGRPFESLGTLATIDRTSATG